MGRRKIAIEPITEERNRTVTFVKRKAGLFKKAHELSILCQVDIAVIIVGHNHKVYEFTSTDTDELLSRYKNAPKLQEAKRPGDYGDYDKVSRISEFPGKRKGKQITVKRAAGHGGDDVDEADEEDDDDDEVDEDAIAAELNFEDEDEDDGFDDDHSRDNKRALQLQTPSKPSKMRRTSKRSQRAANSGNIAAAATNTNTANTVPQNSNYNQVLDQSRIQSTFQHQRALLQQQQGNSPLPPLSTFPLANHTASSPAIKYYSHAGAGPSGAAAAAVQYAPSPAYSSTSSNGGGTTSSVRRPVLRVQIPSSAGTNDESASNNNETAQQDGLLRVADNSNVKNDSAMTLTAIDSSRNESDQQDQKEDHQQRHSQVQQQDHQAHSNQQAHQNQQQHHQGNQGVQYRQGYKAHLGGPPKAVLPGLGIQQQQPQQPLSIPQPLSAGPHSNSPKSTPISATAPNGMFILPQPQPSPSGSHTNNIFPSPFNSNNGNNNNNNNTSANNTSTGYVPGTVKYQPFAQQQQQLFNGETPLSALPSKYLNNDLLFASPSNFYSNEWNIPFGPGSNGTPIATTSKNIQNLSQVAAAAAAQAQLQQAQSSDPNHNTGNGGNGSGQSGMLSAMMRENNNIMLPSPSQMIGNVFNSGPGNNQGANKRDTRE